MIISFAGSVSRNTFWTFCIKVWFVSIFIFDGVTVKTESQPWRNQMIWTGCVRRTRKSKKTTQKHLVTRYVYSNGCFNVGILPIYRTHSRQSSQAPHCLAFAAVFGTNLARLVVQGKCSGLSALHEKTWFSKRCLPHLCFSLTVKRSRALIKRLHFTLAYIRTYLIKHLLEKLRHLPHVNIE